MATMPGTHGHSEACCNIQPIVSSGHVPKGTYEQLGDVTSPANTTKGLVSIFDIFGCFDQTLQRADILATSHEHQKHKILIPDWFKGNPVPTECTVKGILPIQRGSRRSSASGSANNDPHGVAAALPGYVKALQAANPSIKSWGILGYCWGGKVVEHVTSASSNRFTVATAAHPPLIDPAGAEKISVPYILLASGEDSADTVKEFESKLKVPHHVETFADQVTWLDGGARRIVQSSV